MKTNKKWKMSRNQLTIVLSILLVTLNIFLMEDSLKNQVVWNSIVDPSVEIKHHQFSSIYLDNKSIDIKQENKSIYNFHTVLTGYGIKHSTTLNNTSHSTLTIPVERLINETELEIKGVEVNTMDSVDVGYLTTVRPTGNNLGNIFMSNFIGSNNQRVAKMLRHRSIRKRILKNCGNDCGDILWNPVFENQPNLFSNTYQGRNTELVPSGSASLTARLQQKKSHGVFLENPLSRLKYQVNYKNGDYLLKQPKPLPSHTDGIVGSLGICNSSLIYANQSCGTSYNSDGSNILKKYGVIPYYKYNKNRRFDRNLYRRRKTKRRNRNNHKMHSYGDSIPYGTDMRPYPANSDYNGDMMVNQDSPDSGYNGDMSSNQDSTDSDYNDAMRPSKGSDGSGYQYNKPYSQNLHNGENYKWHHASGDMSNNAHQNDDYSISYPANSYTMTDEDDFKMWSSNQHDASRYEDKRALSRLQDMYYCSKYCHCCKKGRKLVTLKYNDYGVVGKLLSILKYFGFSKGYDFFYGRSATQRSTSDPYDPLSYFKDYYNRYYGTPMNVGVDDEVFVFNDPEKGDPEGMSECKEVCTCCEENRKNRIREQTMEIIRKERLRRKKLEGLTGLIRYLIFSDEEGYYDFVEESEMMPKDAEMMNGGGKKKGKGKGRSLGGGYYDFGNNKRKVVFDINDYMRNRQDMQSDDNDDGDQSDSDQNQGSDDNQGNYPDSDSNNLNDNQGNYPDSDSNDPNDGQGNYDDSDSNDNQGNYPDSDSNDNQGNYPDSDSNDNQGSNPDSDSDDPNNQGDYSDSDSNGINGKDTNNMDHSGRHHVKDHHHHKLIVFDCSKCCRFCKTIIPERPRRRRRRKRKGLGLMDFLKSLLTGEPPGSDDGGGDSPGDGGGSDGGGDSMKTVSLGGVSITASAGDTDISVQAASAPSAGGSDNSSSSSPCCFNSSMMTPIIITVTIAVLVIQGFSGVNMLAVVLVPLIFFGLILIFIFLMLQALIPIYFVPIFIILLVIVIVPILLLVILFFLLIPLFLAPVFLPFILKLPGTSPGSVVNIGSITCVRTANLTINCTIGSTTSVAMFVDNATEGYDFNDTALERTTDFESAQDSTDVPLLREERQMKIPDSLYWKINSVLGQQHCLERAGCHLATYSNSYEYYNKFIFRILENLSLSIDESKFTAYKDAYQIGSLNITNHEKCATLYYCNTIEILGENIKN